MAFFCATSARKSMSMAWVSSSSYCSVLVLSLSRAPVSVSHHARNSCETSSSLMSASRRAFSTCQPPGRRPASARGLEHEGVAHGGVALGLEGRGPRADLGLDAGRHLVVAHLVL